MNKEKEAFSLIELLVVIAIIGLLSTLSVIALNSARAKARDAKRISDVKQMQIALEMYYNDMNDYPENGLIEAGKPIQSTLAGSTASTTPFLRAIPNPPTPYDGTACVTNGTNYVTDQYKYVKNSATGITPSYSITFCLGSDIGQGTSRVTAGIRTMTPGGVY